MSIVGNWSVVTKTKKTKGTNHGLTKTQKKQVQDNMPKIAPLEPLKETSTIYDAFLIKEQQKLQKIQQEKFAEKIEFGKEPNGKGISDGGVKKKTGSHKSKKVELVKKKQSYEDAVKEVTQDDLKSVVIQSKTCFPYQPELWLKDLVTFLNMKLENCPENDKHLKKGNEDYPSSALKKGCTDVITSTFKDCSMAKLEHVAYFCVMSMLKESQNGISTYGYKVFLQLLARSKPDTILSKLTKYAEMVKNSRNQPEKCLSLLWTLGQAGIPSLKAGIKLWLDVMLPCLTLRSIGGYCMQFLEHLFSIHGKSLNNAAGEVKNRDFFTILDLVYDASLSADVKKSLLAVYPQLKKIAYRDNLAMSLRHFFPSYLIRVKPESSDLNKELMSNLTECLCKDQQCLPQWCQLYSKQLKASRELLSYILVKWDGLCGSIDVKLLQQTLITFQQVNDKSGCGIPSTEWEDMTNVCEELLKKVTQPKFPWRWLMFFLITAVIAIVTYDIYSSKTLKDSKTVLFLEAYGVLGILQKIWTSIWYCTEIAMEWLQINIPAFYEKMHNIVALFVIRLVELCIAAEEYTREHRRYVTDKIYAIAPNVWNEIERYLVVCWGVVIEYVYWMLEHIVMLYKYVCNWADTNILKGDFSSENIGQTLIWMAKSIQHFTLMALDWCRHLCCSHA